MPPLVQRAEIVAAGNEDLMAHDVRMTYPRRCGEIVFKLKTDVISGRRVRNEQD
jgi:hypothetical protein